MVLNPVFTNSTSRHRIYSHICLIHEQHAGLNIGQADRTRRASAPSRLVGVIGEWRSSSANRLNDSSWRVVLAVFLRSSWLLCWSSETCGESNFVSNVTTGRRVHVRINMYSKLPTILRWNDRLHYYTGAYFSISKAVSESSRTVA